MEKENLLENCRNFERKIGLRHGDCPKCGDAINKFGVCIYCEYDTTKMPTTKQKITKQLIKNGWAEQSANEVVTDIFPLISQLLKEIVGEDMVGKSELDIGSEFSTPRDYRRWGFNTALRQFKDRAKERGFNLE